MKYLISLLLCCISLGAWAQSEPTVVTIGTTTWHQCGLEHGKCSFTGSQNVLYGAFPPVSPQAMYATHGPFTNGVGCDNTSLAPDPAYGYVKACYVQAVASPNTVVVNGVTWTQCASEHSTTNGTCTFSGTQHVLYGAFPPVSPTPMDAVRGPFTGSVACNNTTLGPDPAVGYAKNCYVSNGSSGGTTPPPPVNPTVTLSAAPPSITSGGSSTLTVASTNATSCTGPVTATSGSVTVNPTVTTTYTETCTGAAGSVPAKASVIVTVTSAVTGYTPPPLVNAQNPKSHGALCDGSHDDTSAFQAAVNAGDVLVPAGTCVINGTVNVSVSNKHIQCQGTVLKRTTADNYNMFLIGSSSYNNGVNYNNDSIVGCNFVGANTVAPQFQLGTRQFDIPVETYGRVNYFMLAGNTFKQFWGQSMFQTYSPSNAGTGDIIEYNTFQSCGYYGPVFDAHTNGYIGHNTMVDCAAGVENDSGSQATGGNIIEYNTVGAIYGYGAPDMGSGAMITGGVAGNAQYGTNIVRNNTVSGKSNGLGAHGVQPTEVITGVGWTGTYPAQYQNNTCTNGCVVAPHY